jgi:hypothetical protein
LSSFMAENSTFFNYLDKRLSPNSFLRGCKGKLSSFKKINLNMALIKRMYVISATHKMMSNYSSMWWLDFAPSDSPIKVKVPQKFL